jgi:malate dehydrogenase (oxaloacetate-decarboxylating)
MALDAVVFACANPVPEIWPWDAAAAGARVIATGRSDFPNQLNNSLAFPGIFRGALDVRARSLSDAMALDAADALASVARASGLSEARILPHMGELEAHLRVALATARAAQREGLAGIDTPLERLEADVRRRLEDARALSALLLREGRIPPPP